MLAVKIAFDAYPIAAPRLSGVGVHAMEIASRLCRRKELDCTLLLYDFLKRKGSGNILKERIPNTKVVQNNLLPYGLYVELWDRFPNLGLEQVFGVTADISHFFNFVIPPRPVGKVVNTVHDLVYLNFPETMEKRNYRRLCNHLKRSCQEADIVITVSHTIKQEIADQMGIPKEKIRVVYNGVDQKRFHPNAGRLASMPEHYFLYLGTLEPRKNLTGLLEAYQLGKKRFDGCKLVLGGAKGWEYNEIFQKVRELGLENDVVFPGYLPAERLPALYAGADAFVFPSFYEGFGIPPLEAMACGTPVITSCCSSLPEVAGDAAVLVNPYHREELAAAMERVLTDEILRKTCICRGLERVKKFTWEKAADDVFQIYKELGN